MLKPDERIDDLQRDGLKIIQNPNGFCFGVDAVLLSHFITLKQRDIAVEFGTGTGVIPILLSAKVPFKKIYAFEVQPDVADMAGRSVEMNGLSDRIEIIEDNLKEALRYVPAGSVDAVFSNPPYMAGHSGLKNESSLKAVSRHELLCTLEDIVGNAAKLLKHHGKFYMIHRPHRMVDIFSLCRKYHLEPKVIQMVQPFRDKAPNLFLLMCRRDANPELTFLDPLTVYERPGVYTQEIYDIYDMQHITAFTDKKEERP